MSALYKEMRDAAFAVSSVDFQRAKTLGILNPGVIEFGKVMHQFGVMTIEDAGDGLFHPSLTGRRALVVPVLERGEVIDLCAFFSRSPEHWLLRSGLGWALGEEALSRGYWGETPELRATPLDWLRAGCTGICVVDWSAPEVVYLRDFPRLICPDEGVADLLRAALTRPNRIPEISIKEDRLAA